MSTGSPRRGFDSVVKRYGSEDVSSSAGRRDGGDGRSGGRQSIARPVVEGECCGLSLCLGILD